MRQPRGGDGDGSRRRERWLLLRADLSIGAGRLLTLWHPLLPEFGAALPAAEGLLLLPRPAPPEPLARSSDPRDVAAFLARLAALASFLKFHGLGVAFEDVGRIGSRPGVPRRPALGAVPVPEWRAVPPALLVAAVAARLGGVSVSGPESEGLRTSIERALESRDFEPEAAAHAVEALQAHATATSPEGLVPDLAKRSREGPSLGPDLLGLAFPSVSAGTEDGAPDRVRAASGEAALFVVRGAARRSPSGFVEVPAGDRLEEGSALKRLARLLREDPRTDALAALASGRPVVTWPSGPPVAVVAIHGDLWDDRSRKALDGELCRAGFRVFETRSRAPRPWEPRLPVTARLGRGDVASLFWLPFRSWPEAAAAWDGVASASREDPARFIRLARSLAAAFDPAGRRAVTAIRFRPVRREAGPLLSAAALLGAGFSGAELSTAAGVPVEEAAGAIERAGDDGLLVPEGPQGWRFADEAERRRGAGRLSSAARRSVVERLERSGLEEKRLVIAALSRGEDEDVRAAGALLDEAMRRGDRTLASDLLARAPRHAPDLGRPATAVRIFTEEGRLAEARSAAARLSPEEAGPAPEGERLALARLMARLGQAEKALALVPGDGSGNGLLARVQLLLDLKRTEEAAESLSRLPESAPEGAADFRLRRARLSAEVASRQGNLAAARRLLDEASREISASSDREEAREFLMTAGFVAIDEGRFLEARALFRRARDLSPDPRRRADAALDASTCSFHAGDFAESEKELETALAQYAEAGDEDRYLSALGNRIDLAFRAGRYDLARETLSQVLRFESRPGREHLFLFAVASRQQLARMEGDDEAAAAAYREAEARRAAVPGHPAWREILILEGARLLTARRPAEALSHLQAAGELPDNREQTEPLRARLLVSATGDLGREAERGPPAFRPAERMLLDAEDDLRAGRAPRPAAMSELESRLADARGSASIVERLLEWKGRFPEAFARPASAGILDLGRRAAARAGLPAAGRRFTLPLEERSSRPPGRGERPEPPPFVAEDPGSRKVLEQVRKVARTKLSVLILGETGTGKELLAREVHRLSGRPGRFVPVNVAALPGSLIESELFGHVRGAFTGADRDRIGLVEESSGGTLFLDEIGDLALPLQAKLLRVLQEAELRRVGDTRTRSVDLRVVSATHRDLAAMGNDGSFRRDLLYRLGGLEVALPPLRSRPRDLSRLVEIALGPAALTSEARSAVFGHPWPGNVRELLSALEAARALAAPSVLVGLEHLPTALRPSASARPAGSYREMLREAKTRAISGALEANGGNRTRAARQLGLSRQSLLYEMKVLGLKP